MVDKPTEDAQMSMPDEITPELLAVTSDLEGLAKVPFYISEYVPDALERLKSIVPLSVRHRKALVRILREDDPDIDPRDEEGFYANLLSYIEERPGAFLLVNLAVVETIPKNKRSRAPGPRANMRVCNQEDFYGDLLERYQSASGEDYSEALFDLFLKHLVESSRVQLADTKEEMRERRKAAEEVKEEEPEDIPPDSVFAHEGQAQGEPEEDEEEPAPHPIPEALREAWQRTCAALEDAAGEMGDRLDARRLDDALTLLGELERLAEDARTQDDPVRRIASEAIAGAFVSDAVGEAEARLAALVPADMEALPDLLRRLRTQYDEIEAVRGDISALEADAQEKLAAKSWTEVGRLSTEIAELGGRLGELDAAALATQGEIEETLGLILVWTEEKKLRVEREDDPAELEGVNLVPEEGQVEDDPTDASDEVPDEAELPSGVVVREEDTGVEVTSAEDASDLGSSEASAESGENERDEADDGREPEVQSEPEPVEVEVLPAGDVEAALRALIDADRLAIAARFSGALESHGHPGRLGADVLRATAASRLSFESYDTSVQAFSTLVNAASVEKAGDAETEERRNVLLFGGLLRPAILMRELQIRQIVGDLNLRSYGPTLAELQEAIQDLDYNFAPKVDDLAQAAGKPEVSRLDAVRRELVAWHEQAKMRSGPCQPSTYVLNKIVSSGEVGRVVDDVLAGKASLDAIDAVIERFADRSAIETRAREINRGTGTRSKGHFPQISLQYMYRNIGEGIDLLIRYRDVAQRDRKRKSSEIDQLPRRASALQSKIEAARAGLRAEMEEAEEGLDRTLAEWVLRRIDELDQMLSGQDIQTYGTLVAALGDELDLLPAGCQPLSPDPLRINLEGNPATAERGQLRQEDRRVLEAVLAGRILTPKDSFEEKIAAGAFSAAERLALRLSEEGEGQISLMARVAEARSERLNSLDHEVGEVSRKLKDLAKIDLKFQDQITREIDRLDEIVFWINQWRGPVAVIEPEAVMLRPLEVFQVPDIIAGAERLIEEVEHAIKDDQIARLEQIAHDRTGMRREIESLKVEIDTMSPEMVEDRLALIRDGRPIGEVRDRKSRVFVAFFPGFVEAAGREDWPSTAEAYEAAFSAEAEGEQLRIAPERRAPAGELVSAWFKMARQLQSDVTRPAALASFLEALTFTVDKVHDVVRLPGVRQACLHEVRMGFQFKDFFCPPEFGSKAHGRYKALIIGPNVLFEQIDDHLEQDVPTIVIVNERMSVEKRREFARGLRRRGVPALLIDEMLTAFIAISTTSRLETLFDCGLPFGSVEPYTTAAGRLPPEMFFGREREIGLIYRREVDGCLVYGGRQLGKSALLSHVEERYHNPDKGIIVQRREVNSLGGRAEPASNVWSRIAQMLGDHGVVPSGETSEEGVTRHIRDWLKMDSSRRIILLLDETDRFMSSEARNGYPNLIPLKALMEATHRNFKVVFAGLHNVRRMLKEPNSPLAHLGEPICIGPLNATHEDKASARRLIIEPMRAAGFTFENEMAVENILAYVNDYPSLVQTFCKGLLEFLHRQEEDLGEGPLWKIPDDMIFKGEGFDEIRREIRSKFQLTLDLDPRYALIANVLGLIRTDFGEERVLRTGLAPTEIREEAMKHWPASIQTVDEAGFRVLLDELFELGVLGRIEISGNSQYHYVLRTRQVAQMLGQEPDIIEALVNIQDREPEVDYDAPSYRRAYEPKGATGPVDVSQMKRSPLSDSQISDLLDPARAGCRFVTGLPVMGLREVPTAIEQVLGPRRAWGKVEDITVVTVTNAKVFRREIEQVKAARGSKRMKLVFIKPSAAQVSDLVTFAERWGQVKSGDVRPIFLLDATDDVLRDLAVKRDATALIPWGHEMLRAYLQEVEALSLDSRELRTEILRLTGGIPAHICDIVKAQIGEHGRVTAESLARAAEPIDAGQYVPGASLGGALSMLEDVDDAGDYQAMMDLLASEGHGTAEDVIPDLRMLGLVQTYSPDEGRLRLSAFGRLVQAAAFQARKALEPA